MKRKLILIAGFCFIVVALLSGCTTTNTVTAPPSTGQIIGSVQLEEMDCTPSKSSAGVTVQILGTKITAVSDSAGNFTLNGVPAGYWTIRYSKLGYSVLIGLPDAFVGSGTLWLNPGGGNPVLLGRVPDWKTTLFAPIVDTTTSTGYYYFSFPSNTPKVVDSSGNTVPNGATRLALFVGRQPSINYMDTNTYLDPRHGRNPAYFNRSLAAGGDTLYMVAYPFACAYSGYTYQETYYLGDTLKTEFLPIGPPSNTVKFVLP
jgi:hypothetical protein